MQRNVCSLTVFFEGPFWVGVFQRTDGSGLEACKVTFGAEPKDYEVYDFLLKNWGRLRFSPAVQDAAPEEKRRNPKRAQRTIRRALQQHGAGTKAQMALQLQREQEKQERQQLARVRRQAEQARRFQIRQEKKKQKHKGR